MNHLIIILFQIVIIASCNNKIDKNINEIHTSETEKKLSDTSNSTIIKEIETEALIFEKEMDKEWLTSEAIQFKIDTFKINLKNNKRQKIDYSTRGMINSVIEMTEEYEKLLNKYYNKLLLKLDSTDRIILINSQKDWLKYRKSEEKFIQVMLNTKYNSGGTIQSNFAVGDYFGIVENRTIQVFSHYNSIVEKEEFGGE